MDTTNLHLGAIAHLIAGIGPAAGFFALLPNPWGAALASIWAGIVILAAYYNKNAGQIG